MFLPSFFPLGLGAFGRKVFEGSGRGNADRNAFLGAMSLLNLQAASLTVTWPTSYEALVGRAQTQPGEWVLVHAAAGGVGLIAVQIAKGERLPPYSSLFGGRVTAPF